MILIKFIKTLYYSLRYRDLNPPWLQQKLITEDRSPAEIADIIGCNVDLINEKIIEYGLNAKDDVFGIYTGRFHQLAKHRGVVALVKPFIKNIETTTDEIYTRTKSINSKIFKDILIDVQNVDRDGGKSSGAVLGYPRKAFYFLMTKFIICLYEFDVYYAERMDYILMEVLERKEEFYLSPITTNPENWYPTRTEGALQEYFVGRIFGNKDVELYQISKE